MKAKKQTVYKVVARRQDELISAYVGWAEDFSDKKKNHFTRTYAVGKRTFPVPGTKLFVFTALEDAVEYAREFNRFTRVNIYEAEATGVESGARNFIYCYLKLSFDELRRIFQDQNDLRFERYSGYPSSATATSVRLTRKIQ